MLKLPEKINQQFQHLLINKGFSEKEKDKYFYSKWLCFYWNFCHKYQHPAFDQNSLPLFLTKLQEKGQPKAQRKQTSMAIAILYEIASTSNINKRNTVRGHLPEYANAI